VSFEVYITPVLYDADELLECLVMADNCLLRGLSLKLHFVTDSDSHIVTLFEHSGCRTRTRAGSVDTSTKKYFENARRSFDSFTLVTRTMARRLAVDTPR